jgi:glutamyl-tRNA reductase
MPLVGCELALAHPEDREAVVSLLARSAGHGLLILDTCQRLECYGFREPELPSITVGRTWRDASAFERLARIAAGLESRILGELEVLGQVRDAYRRFRADGGTEDAALDRMFQDALAVARKARRKSGIDRTLTSLGSVAARLLLARVPGTAPLAIVGSGSLAGSVARHLAAGGQRAIRIAGRCPENALRLAARINGFASGLNEMAHLFEGVRGIITATAAPHPVVFPHHLARSDRPLTIIDLGTPPDCSPEVRGLPGLAYVPLREVEERAQVNVEDRRRRAEAAARIVHEGALEWARPS